MRSTGNTPTGGHSHYARMTTNSQPLINGVSKRLRLDEVDGGSENSPAKRACPPGAAANNSTAGTAEPTRLISMIREQSVLLSHAKTTQQPQQQQQTQVQQQQSATTVVSVSGAAPAAGVAVNGNVINATVSQINVP